MEISIDITPLLSKKTGVGVYTEKLLEKLLHVAVDHQLKLGAFAWGFSDPIIREIYQKYRSEKVSIRIYRGLASLLRWFWYRLNLPKVETMYGSMDVYHSPNFIAPAVKKVPIVITVHDLAFVKFPSRFPVPHNYRTYISTSVKRSSKIIAVSASTKQDLIELFDLPEEKTEVIYQGLDTERFKPLPTSAVKNFLSDRGLPEKYFIFVGTLEPRKNLVTLLKAFCDIKTQKKDPHKLLVVGEKGWHYRDIFQMVASLEISREVIFLGYVPEEELPYLYNGADLLLYPSLYEGFGFPILEAMACGTPVITSNISSLPEVAGKAAVLVDPMDEKGLKLAIESLISDKNTYVRYQELGFARVKKFSWERCAMKTLDVYESLQ